MSKDLDEQVSAFRTRPLNVALGHHHVQRGLMAAEEPIGIRGDPEAPYGLRTRCSAAVGASRPWRMRRGRRPGLAFHLKSRGGLPMKGKLPPLPRQSSARRADHSKGSGLLEGKMMAKRFNSPPGWPPAPQGWLPPAGWQPDPSWPPPPVGWRFVVDEPAPQYAPSGRASLPRGPVVERPWYKKKRFLAPIGFVAFLFVIGALNGEDPAAPTAGRAEGSSVVADQPTTDEAADLDSEEAEAAAAAEAEVEAAAAAEAEAAAAEAERVAAAEAAAAQAAAEAAAAYGAQPADQTRFVEIVAAAQVATSAAENDLQIGAVKAERDQALCGLLQSKAVTGWTGRLTEIDANNGGKGVLTIEIANDIEIKTWNNAFSDFADDTLIEPNTPVFNAALTLTEGQVVRFSGTLIDGGSDCLSEASLTLKGGLETPSFILRFSDLAAG